ncbi:STM4013/SEN3800 family hydrolase [Trichocoleus sp. FACHB-591]|uniref:STM4013/SEN3800 family hydrolase n=1 Tax=Trichocoleus sp. FACHB-591 TaxID=2692872 RepID=UPI001688E00D|nr:STM4013/SEN3800 family hydrolase [Trichocoleus sp. FACHB-591]MBD2096395.1 STM4013/SEN3800 family hydrolase [Trichocoleus sp. FACHB-591]
MDKPQNYKSSITNYELRTTNYNTIVGTHDIIFITFDTLRYDVAQSLWQAGRTPHLAALLPNTGWKKRHSPGSFTYAAHHAFFAGFLPTPVTPGHHPRPFALQFEGSATIAPETCVLNGASLPEGLANRGYRTICIGGVGFFNQCNPLGKVLPGLFQEQYWSPELGVTDRHSTEHQVALACDRLNVLSSTQRVFLFINLSALHQPNYFYFPGATTDSIATHAAALEYIDRALVPLWQTLRDRAPTLGILCSDHGTTYGEDGYTGHRLAHPTVWTVPYAEVLLNSSP